MDKHENIDGNEDISEKVIMDRLDMKVKIDLSSYQFNMEWEKRQRVRTFQFSLCNAPDHINIEDDHGSIHTFSLDALERVIETLRKING